MPKIDKLIKKIQKPSFFIIGVIGILIILDIPAYFQISFYTEQNLGIYLSLILFGTFITIPASKKKGFSWLDCLFALLAFPAGLFITFFYPSIAVTMGTSGFARTFFGILTVLLILEALRRSMGISLTVIVAVFLIYTKFASFLPGILHGRVLHLPRMMNYIYLDPNSLLYMLSFGATIGVAFIFFGQVLLNYGGGKAFIDIALIFCGKLSGGSAKTAVVASSLVGTITGAPMSNVLLTGSVTIPMMKADGYPPETAASVEAVASSGGQIMPPVMGIAAFIIAETLGVSYSKVALAALIPALLFYFAIFVQVHLDAKKLNIKPIDPSRLKKTSVVLNQSWFIIPPIIILLSLLFFIAYPPALSAVITGAIALPLMLVKRENRSDFFKKLRDTLVETGRLVISIGTVMAAAGLIIGSINASGLAFNLSLALTSLGQHSVILLLISAAVASLILGMGMPSVAAYALVAILVAPSLIKFGIVPMAAHLFVFYFAVISNITPPVAVSCYAAAPLAGANPTKTGFKAFRLGIASYIVPFVFCFDPSLLLMGAGSAITIRLVFMLIGLWGVCVVLSGYLKSHLSVTSRLIIAVLSIVILLPVNFLINTIGVFGLTVYYLILQKSNRKIAISLSI